MYLKGINIRVMNALKPVNCPNITPADKKQEG